MQKIISDSLAYPLLFHWFGPVEKEKIVNWMQNNHLKSSRELIDLWEATGGGDFFESETILGPFANVNMADDVLSVNQYHWSRKMPQKLLVFHTGLGELTAINTDSEEIVVLSYDNYVVKEKYSSIENWYEQSIRSEYTEHYGLNSSQQVQKQGIDHSLS